MKLSEAIRIGAQKRPQCFEVLYLHPLDQKNKSGVIESCVIGAALEGSGEIDPERIEYPCTIQYNRILRLERVDEMELVECSVKPFCGYSGAVINVIQHLNDAHRMTREGIAAWLESIGY